MHLIDGLRSYVERLQANIPDAEATQAVRSLVERYDDGQISDLNAELARVARTLHQAARGAGRLVAYDLLWISQGYEPPVNIGHYYREARANNRPFE